MFNKIAVYSKPAMKHVLFLKDDDPYLDSFYESRDNSKKFLNSKGERYLSQGFYEWLISKKEFKKSVKVAIVEEKRINVTHGHHLDFNEFAIIKSKIKVKSLKSFNPSDAKVKFKSSSEIAENLYDKKNERNFGIFLLSREKSARNLLVGNRSQSEIDFLGAENVMDANDPRRLESLKIAEFVKSFYGDLIYEGYSKTKSKTEGWRALYISLLKREVSNFLKKFPYPPLKIAVLITFIGEKDFDIPKDDQFMEIKIINTNILSSGLFFRGNPNSQITGLRR